SSAPAGPAPPASAPGAAAPAGRARPSRNRPSSLLLSQVADVLDLAAEDLDRGAHRRVLAGERDPTLGCRRPLLLLLLCDRIVRRRVLLDDLERRAEPQRLLEGALHRRPRFLDDGGLARAFAESDLHRRAVAL